MAAFCKWFRAQVQKKTGLSPDTHSLVAWYTLLELDKSIINRESFRKLMREESDPPDDTQRKLRHHLAHLKRVHPACGKETAQLLSKLFGSTGNNFRRVDSRKLPPTDIQCEVPFANVSVYFRCIEDDPDDSTAGRFYFAEHISDLEQLAPFYSSIILVTHRNPNAAAIAHAVSRSRAGCKILIMRLGELIGTQFSLETLAKEISSRLRLAAMDSVSTLVSIPAIVTDSQQHAIDITDSLTFVEKTLGERGARTLFAVGQFGSGKSGLTCRTAKILLDRANAANVHLPLPVLVEGSSIAFQDGALAAIHAAVQRCYATSLNDDELIALIRSGDLVIIIDALDESIALYNVNAIETFIRSLPELGKANSKYLLTCRGELFRSGTEYDRVKSLVSTTVSLSPVPIGDVRASLVARLGAAEANSLMSDALRSQAISDLIRTPLFLEIVSQTQWRPSYIGLEGDQPGSSSRVLYHLFREYTNQWATRENLRHNTLELAPDERTAFCVLMAEVAFDAGNEAGIVSDQDIVASVKTFRPRAFKHTPITEVDEVFDRFVRDARLSMFLVRDDRRAGFRFAHQSASAYFLGRALADVLVKAASGKDVSLRALARQEMHTSMALLTPMVVGALLEAGQDPLACIESALSLLRRSSQSLHQPSGSSAVTTNLIFLYITSAELLGTPADLSLSGLSAPFMDFDILRGETPGAEKPQNHIIDAARANIEFAQRLGTTAHDVRKSVAVRSGAGTLHVGRLPTTPHTLSERKRRIAELLEYCWQNGVLKDKQYKDTRFGSRWTVVPGGLWPLHKHVVASEAQQSEDTPLTLENVFLSSYLIQRHPVTNAAFLEFLQSPASRHWWPLAQRGNKHNDYYLRGWDSIAQELTYDISRWTLELVTKNNTVRAWWPLAPVIYVSRPAAIAYASHHGWCLPSEAQYEAAGRMYVDNLHKPNVFPWPDAEPDGFAIYLNADALDVPMFDCTVTSPVDRNGKSLTPKFEEWAKLHGTDNVPLHLAGGVREWVSDTYSADWPLGTTSVNLGKVTVLTDPVNDGLERRHGNIVRKRTGDAQATMRGGSLQLAKKYCTITYRAPQIGTNINPDNGFRCVMTIAPTTK